MNTNLILKKANQIFYIQRTPLHMVPNPDPSKIYLYHF